MDTAETFSELRAILARDPTEDDWDLVLRRLDRVDQAPEAERQRFDGEYGHYIRAALERWPADVRAIRWDEDRPRALELARTLELTFPPDQYRRQRKLDAYHRTVDLLEDPRCAGIDGLEVHGLREQASSMLDELLGRRPGLRRLDLSLQPARPGGRQGTADGELRIEQVPALVARVAELLGDRLEHLGLRYTHTYLEGEHDALDVMWGAFVEHIPRFERLRSLSLGQLRTSELGSPTWAPRLLALPEVRRVEELCLRCVYKDVEVAHLSAGGAWPNLRRLKLLGATDEDARKLIAAPELSGVDTWASYDWAPARRPRGWGGPRTRMWTEWALEQRARRAEAGEA